MNISAAELKFKLLRLVIPPLILRIWIRIPRPLLWIGLLRLMLLWFMCLIGCALMRINIALRIEVDHQQRFFKGLPRNNLRLYRKDATTLLSALVHRFFAVPRMIWIKLGVTLEWKAVAQDLNELHIRLVQAPVRPDDDNLSDALLQELEHLRLWSWLICSLRLVALILRRSIILSLLVPRFAALALRTMLTLLPNIWQAEVQETEVSTGVLLVAVLVVVVVVVVGVDFVLVLWCLLAELIQKALFVKRSAKSYLLVDIYVHSFYELPLAPLINVLIISISPTSSWCPLAPIVVAPHKVLPLLYLIFIAQLICLDSHSSLLLLGPIPRQRPMCDSTSSTDATRLLIVPLT